MQITLFVLFGLSLMMTISYWEHSGGETKEGFDGTSVFVSWLGLSLGFGFLILNYTKNLVPESLGFVCLLVGLGSLIKTGIDKKIKKPVEPEPEPEPEQTDDWFDYLNANLDVPPQYYRFVHTLLQGEVGHNPASVIGAVNQLFKILPHPALLDGDPKRAGRVRLRDYTFAEHEKNKDIITASAYRVVSKLRCGEKLLDCPININIPDNLRTEHMHIVASSGMGKTQLLQSLILDDLTTANSVVVIDSQDEMINKLATRIPPERLVFIDPATCPPALNLFSGVHGEQQTATVVELYEYIFSALEAQMTSKQQTAYRFVTRLLLQIPNANIHTMREIFESGTAHQEYIRKLDATAQSFFHNEFNSRQFAETRSQILRRLYTVLESATLSKMLGASESSLDIPKLLNEGKFILISTSKNFLKQTSSSLFGRIFIAQVMQAVMTTTNRRRTHLYIDEAQDYFEDSHVLFNLFEQARKYNLGLTVAHQYLGQLTPKLRESISANTAIKFASGVSSEDASKLASQMHTDKDFLLSKQKGQFACYFKGYGIYTYGVEFGRLENTPELTKLSSIQAKMNEQYGVKYEPEPTPLQEVAEPKDIQADEW